MKNLHLLSETEFEQYLDTINGSPKGGAVRRAKTQRNFEQQLTHVGYSLISEYINNSTKTLIQCDNPKHVPYHVTPRDFKSSGTRCPACSGKCPKQAKEQLVQTISNAGYTLLSEYVNAKTKVLVQCDNQEHKPYFVTPSGFKSGNRCLVCAGKCTNDAKKVFENIVSMAGYSLLGEYNTNETKVLVYCGDTDHQPYYVVPSNFRRGSRCPCCSKRGFNPSKKSTLYVTLLEDKTYICVKIGITNNDIYTRFAVKDHDKIQRAWEYTIENGAEIARLEKQLHHLYKEKKKDCGTWLNSGNTELFETSILNEVLGQLDFIEVTK